MATIVNARDVMLQAYSPRVATVSSSPGLVIDPSQVTGLGLIIEGTKMVFLSATTQVFQIAKSGTVNPASTVLTASIKNLTNTPTLTVVSGTITPAPALVSGVVTIPYAHLLTDAATIRLTLVQDTVTYTDEITIVKVREGVDGLVGFLTNEAHTLPADYLGNVLNYAGAGGNFKVFQGINDITSVCSFSIPSGGNTSALTTSINATTGAYTMTGNYPTFVSLASILFRATFGAATLDKVFTLAKTREGTPGVDGVDGVDGASGQRGSRTFYVTLTGTTAVFSDPLATTTASVSGGPVLNDVVTQYNTSQGFSQTKFYTAGGWVVVNAVVDGNLLVSGTVGATQLQANLLNADNVLTRGLTVRDNSGNIILSSGQALDYSKVGGTTKPANNATVGATFGSNISGQITAATASTYIAAAAIANAQIGTLDAAKINTGYLSADRLQAGTIDATKLSVGFSNNLLDNSTFAHGGANWTFEQSVNVSATVGFNQASYTPIGGTSGYVYQPNALYAGENTRYQGVYSKMIPVVAGNRYEFSAYVGVISCNASALLLFYNSAGTPLTQGTSTTNNQEAAGGTSLAAFKRVFGFVTAPANAVSARLFLRKTPTAVGQPGSWLFMTQAMVAQAALNQTMLSDWSLGGTGTKITGEGIETGTVTADKINGTNLAVVNGTFSGSLTAATGTFAGSLSAATGTFSGTLTASAINAVSTINLANNSVTVSSSASGASTASCSVNVPSGQTMRLVCLAYSGPITISGDPAYVGVNGVFNGTAYQSSSFTGNTFGVGNIHSNDSTNWTGHAVVSGPATVSVTVNGSGVTCALFGGMK